MTALDDIIQARRQAALAEQARKIEEINRRCVYRAAHHTERRRLAFADARRRDMSAAEMIALLLIVACFGVLAVALGMGG